MNTKTEPAKPKPPEYRCADCGGDAFVGMSNLVGPHGRIIGKKERLCMACCRKRGAPRIF